MANNKLKKYTYFDKTQVNVSASDTFLEIHLNNNHINKIEYLSFIVGNLKLLNFESNNVSFIELDAFLNCRSLEYLSLANNRLGNITENMFHFLFSLVHLNLSSNEIEYIENASKAILLSEIDFQNLLESLPSFPIRLPLTRTSNAAQSSSR